MDSIMNADTILKELWEAFGSIKRPTRITTKGIKKDMERIQIEKQFQGVERKTMSYDEVSMMLVDGALIDPKSYFYFLPRLAEAVLHEGADGFLLRIRIENLDFTGLTAKQVKVIRDLKKLLEQLDEKLDEK